MHNVIRREAVDLRLAERMDAVIVHTRHGAELLGGGERVHVIPHGAFEHLTRQPHERAASRRARRGRAAGGALLRRDPALQGRRRAGRGVPAGRGRRAVGGGAAARGVDGAPAPARAAGPGALRGPLRERRGAAGVLPARRRARAAAPERRRVGRAVRGARVRQGDGAERRRRLPRARGGARGGGARAAGGPGRAGGRHQRAARATPSERRRLEERAAAAAAGPFSWDRIAEQTASLYEQVRS